MVHGRKFPQGFIRYFRRVGLAQMLQVHGSIVGDDAFHICRHFEHCCSQPKGCACGTDPDADGVFVHTQRLCTCEDEIEEIVDIGCNLVGLREDFGGPVIKCDGYQPGSGGQLSPGEVLSHILAMHYTVWWRVSMNEDDGGPPEA